MKETPNLNYVEELAGNDEAFKKKMINVLQFEFPLEKEKYLNNFALNKFQEAGQDVHKIKHKISILGLEKGYSLAEELEGSLNNPNATPHNLHEKFTILLQIIQDYITRL